MSTFHFRSKIDLTFGLVFVKYARETEVALGFIPSTLRTPMRVPAPPLITIAAERLIVIEVCDAISTQGEHVPIFT